MADSWLGHTYLHFQMFLSQMFEITEIDGCPALSVFFNQVQLFLCESTKSWLSHAIKIKKCTKFADAYVLPRKNTPCSDAHAQ